MKIIKESMKKFQLPMLIVLLLLVALSGFYWYEWRPSQIKRECVWIKRHEDAKPAVEAQESYHPEGSNIPSWAKTPEIEASPAIPAKDWIEQSTPYEYERCLHTNGL